MKIWSCTSASSWLLKFDIPVYQLSFNVKQIQIKNLKTFDYQNRIVAIVQ